MIQTKILVLWMQIEKNKQTNSITKLKVPVTVTIYNKIQTDKIN